MQSRRARALVQAGGRLLTVDEVADAAVAPIGTGGSCGRFLRCGGVVRLGSLLPGHAEPAFRALELVGRRLASWP
jgi:hypothetical protein